MGFGVGNRDPAGVENTGSFCDFNTGMIVGQLNAFNTICLMDHYEVPGK